MARKITFLFISVLFLLSISEISADNFTDILQDLAVQTACLGRYSTAHTGVYVTSRYDDPPDWYDPPMMANRFAKMSGNMTRINTFYGVCFDYAQFAWDDINDYQKMYNEAGMKGQEWYIAATNVGDPYTIILYDPVSKDKATTISNGVYLKENSRHKVYAHDGATGHAWLWVQHNNGTWYWIDPTWTDNTGYVWWGIVENGREVQKYPNPDYCVVSDYPRPIEARPTEVRPTEVRPTEVRPTEVRPKSETEKAIEEAPVLLGYSYNPKLLLGFMIGFGYTYFTIGFGIGGMPGDNEVDGVEHSYILFGHEGQYSVTEWIVGLSIPLLMKDRRPLLLMPLGIGANHSGIDTDRQHNFIMEIGIMPVIFNFIYFSATYRWLTGFEKSGFTIGAGFVF